MAEDHRRGPRKAQRQWRRHRAWRSARRLRHQADDHAVQRAEAAQQALRSADHVRRRRHGERDHRRAAVRSVHRRCSNKRCRPGLEPGPITTNVRGWAELVLQLVSKLTSVVMGPLGSRDDELSCPEETLMTHPSIHARTQPNKIAYQMAGTGKAITYRELDELSNHGAHLSRALGLKAGDHIALLMENRLAFMEICWAAQRSGLYYTAISRYLTEEEIAY